MQNVQRALWEISHYVTVKKCHGKVRIRLQGGYVAKYMSFCLSIIFIVFNTLRQWLRYVRRASERQGGRAVECQYFNKNKVISQEFCTKSQFFTKQYCLLFSYSSAALENAHIVAGAALSFCRSVRLGRFAVLPLVPQPQLYPVIIMLKA